MTYANEVICEAYNKLDIYNISINYKYVYLGQPFLSTICRGDYVVTDTSVGGVSARHPYITRSALSDVSVSPK